MGYSYFLIQDQMPCTQWHIRIQELPSADDEATLQNLGPKLGQPIPDSKTDSLIKGYLHPREARNNLSSYLWVEC